MRLQRKKQNQAANRSMDVGSHRNAYYSDSASHASTLVSPSSSEDWCVSFEYTLSVVATLTSWGLLVAQVGVAHLRVTGICYLSPSRAALYSAADSCRWIGLRWSEI